MILRGDLRRRREAYKIYLVYIRRAPSSPKDEEAANALEEAEELLLRRLLPAGRDLRRRAHHAEGDGGMPGSKLLLKGGVTW